MPTSSHSLEKENPRHPPAATREPLTTTRLRRHQDGPGLCVLPTTPWGTHICVFYETKYDLIDMHIDYFKAGLEANEHCVWAISDPITREVALEALRRAIPSFKHYLADGRIDILPGYEWYLKGGESTRGGSPAVGTRS